MSNKLTSLITRWKALKREIKIDPEVSTFEVVDIYDQFVDFQ